MDERQASALARPYVLPAEDEQTPAQLPRGRAAVPTGGAHRSAQDDDALPGGRAGPGAPGGPTAQLGPGWTPPVTVSRSVRRRTVSIRSHGETLLDRWWPAARALQQNWIIATAAALGVVLVFVAVIMTRDPTTRTAPNQAGDILGAAQTVDAADWLTPSDPAVPAPPAGSLPPGAGPWPFPPADDQSAARPTAPAAPNPSAKGRPGSTPEAVRTKPTRPTRPPQNATAYDTRQAENFAGQQGIKTEPDKSGGGVHIGFISTGDWVRYDNVGFTDSPAHTLLFSASNAARQNRTGQVEVRLDQRSNAPIGSIKINNNGDWFAFTTYRVSITPTTGVHTVYLTFSSNQNEEFANLDWLRFQR